MIVNHFEKYDHFYIDRLLPMITQNSKINVLGQAYVISRRDEGYFIAVSNISENGLCSPSLFKALGDYSDHKELNKRCAYMLSLLGY